jgi:AbrB family looped-hinge helix DNA binding protein
MSEEMVVVNKRGQFTIPARLRKLYHIKEGTKMLISQGEYSIVVRPLPEFDDLLGMHSGEISLEEVFTELDQMRKQDRY